jgi:hypothetical protein
LSVSKSSSSLSSKISTILPDAAAGTCGEEEEEEENPEEEDAFLDPV